MRESESDVMERSNWGEMFGSQSTFHLVIREGTYNNPRENSADVGVVSIQPRPGVLVFKSDTTGFKSGLLWRSWC